MAEKTGHPRRARVEYLEEPSPLRDFDDVPVEHNNIMGHVLRSYSVDFMRRSCSDKSDYRDYYRSDSYDEISLKEDYRRALELGVVLSSYARVMLVGAGGVGKSSLLRGLMKKHFCLTASSTPLAETMTVKPVSNLWVSDAGTFWKVVTDVDEINELVGLVHLVAKAFSGEIDSPRYIEMMREKFPQSVKTKFTLSVHTMQSSLPAEKSIEEIQREIVRDILSRAIEIAMKNPRARVPLVEILLHLWDCGGQAVFLDILPAFLTPRMVFLSLYDARRDLTDPCLIQSFKEGKVISEQYHSATTVELLLEWMASIYAMLGTSTSDGTIPKYPRIIPVGTHGDDSRVKTRKEEIIANLTHEYENKTFAHLVKKGVIVDNTTAGKENEDPGYAYIRQQIHELTSKELTVRTPVAWVLFRKVFQKVVKESKSPIVSLKLTREIAAACNIPEDTISSMLKFYHDLAVFFHYTAVPSLRDQVIADPQWLVKEIAKLLALEGFESVDNPALWKPLRESGILVQPLYEEVWEDIEPYISSQSLIDLLVHFKIAVPIAQKEYKFPGMEYYVPCVLPFYRPETSVSSPVEISGGKVIKQAAPLHLLFNTHHVPPGYFTRLATCLSSDPKCRVLFRHEAYCNRVSILYGCPEGRIDQITLTKQQYSVRIDLVRTLQRQSHDPSFATTCRDIMKLLQNNSLSVLEWFPGVHVHTGFECTKCLTTEPEKKHFIDISPEMSTFPRLQCREYRYCPLDTAHQYWLKISPKNLTSKGVPSTIDDSELQQLASAIESKEKLQTVCNALEMNYYLESIGEDDPETPLEMLRQWCSDMEEGEVHVRSHLIQHLKTSGLTSLAEKMKAAKFRSAAANAVKVEPQDHVMERQLFSCSKFISDKQLPLLEKALFITDKEKSAITSQYSAPDQQAYHMMITWCSKLHNNSQQKLIGSLNAAGLHEAVDNLKKTSQVPEMSDLLKYVKAAARWYTLGTHLKVDRHKLEVICRDHHNDSETALMVVFKAWLDNTEEPSWNIIVKALKDTELSVLASEIEDKFCI